MTRRAVRYKKREINLATARTNEVWEVAGGLVYMLTATDKSATLSLRFDGPQEEPVDFTKGDGVASKFNRLYITNAVQAGKTITILVTPGRDIFEFLLAPQVADIDTIGTINTITTLENIADDLTRLLGVVDISDDAARLLGVVASITAPVDISDDATRLLGVVDSITDPVTVAGAVDVSDRAARLLGVVASITAAVDISDRAARLLGKVTVSPAAGFDEVGFDANNVTNPSSGDVLVTTGDLPAGHYEIFWKLASSSNTSGIALQKRNASDTVLETNELYTGSQDSYSGRLVVQMAVNEDMVIRATSGPTASFGAYISWRRLL